MNIGFSPPDITQEEIDEVTDTLRSGWLTTGPKTKKFECKIAEYCNVKRAVCLNSATAAMELTLHLLGVCEGDEVITTAYTYSASCSVICHVGAIPVIVDTLENSYDMDPKQVERAITKRTKAIIAVDLAGIIYSHYEDLFRIVNAKKALFNPKGEMQKKWGRIFIMADSAHAFGSRKNGKVSGEIADFTCFSFHAVKNLTTGEGGAVTWKSGKGIDDEAIYKQYMLLSLHGQSKDALAKTKLGAWEYDIIAPYYKCNMTDIMASLGLVQIKRYEKLLKRRKEIISQYDAGFAGLPIQVLRHYTNESESSGHLYLVRVLNQTRETCNRIIEKMGEAGIATNVHYKPLPMLSAYQKLGFDIHMYPNACQMYQNEITLPLHTCLTNEEIEYVIDTFKKIIKDQVIC